MPRETLSRSYFETLYERDADPWSFATSDYEHEKYERTLRSLGPQYERALEIGCSIGVLTERLATRCHELVAVDISERALSAARIRCAHVPGVRFECAAIPAEFPAGPFDLVLVSEVGYYWSDADLSRARDLIADAIPAGGDLALVHFLPAVEDYVRDGDAVHAEFLSDDRYTRVHADRAERYRIDVLRRL